MLDARKIAEQRLQEAIVAVNDLASARQREEALRGRLVALEAQLAEAQQERARAAATMTESVARFQVEAAQRERLSSLGRLSTVIAHEIRNPLMIIKATLSTLRRDELT